MSNTARIEIYTKWGCPYCFRAKALLDGKGATYEEFDVTMGGPRKGEMMERAPNHSTVPSIFINGAHVGGSDDLSALDAKGELDAMLAQ